MAEADGTAYVDVRADFRGFDDDVDTAGNGLVSKLTGFGKNAGIAVAAGVGLGVAGLVGAGGALFALGGKFDDVYDTIRTQTGATGERLGDLQQSFRDVAKESFGSFDQVGTAIADLNQRLGLTGQPLEDLSAQFVNLSNVTGEDLTGSIEAVSGALNGWGIGAEDQGEKLDELFRTSQATGIGVTDLASVLGSQGTVLRAAGLSFEDSAAMLGLLEKGGVDAAAVMPSLSKALATAAKNGEDAGDLIRGTFHDIATASDDTEAAGIAMETFGARSGPRLAAMIREGQLSYEDLAASIANGGDTVNAAAEDTADFAERWQNLKNRVFLALEPLANRVFGAIGDGMTAIMPIVESVSAAVEEDGLRGAVGALWEAFSVQFPGIAETVSGFWENVQPTFSAILTAVRAIVDWVVVNWPQIQAVIGEVLGVVQTVIQGFVDLVTTLWQNFGDNILRFLHAAWDPIAQIIDGVLQQIRGIVNVVTGLIHGDWDQVWTGIKQIFSGIWDEMQGKARLALAALQLIISVPLEVIQGAWTRVWGSVRDFFAGVWDGMKTKVSDAWGDIRGFVSGGVNDVIGFVEAIPGKIVDIGKKAWDGLKSSFASAINWIIDAINRINLPSVHIGGWKVGPVSMPSFDTPSVDPFPHLDRIALAAGGIVMPRVGGVDATLAEAGMAEAVIPLDRMSDLLGTPSDDELLDELRALRKTMGRPNLTVNAGAGNGLRELEEYWHREEVLRGR